jgi:hypothetical protein
VTSCDQSSIILLLIVFDKPFDDVMLEHNLYWVVLLSVIRKSRSRKLIETLFRKWIYYTELVDVIPIFSDCTEELIHLT